MRHRVYGTFGREGNDAGTGGELRQQPVHQFKKCPDIERESPIVLAQGKFFDGTVDSGGRAVDENFERRIARIYRLHQALQAFLAGDVGPDDFDGQVFCRGGLFQAFG